jgi:aminoglycoside/choline kinase family phosphotransferase
MEIADVESLTRQELADWASARVATAGGVIDRGGSGRRFFRICQEESPASASLVAMHYSLARRENARFAEITRFLDSLGVPVPRILAAREDLQLLWIEDLGAEDLATFENADWETVRAPLYRLALGAVLPLHQVGEVAPPPHLPELEPGFDEKLYRWEQDYFFEHFAANFSAALGAEIESARTSDDLRELIANLCQAPRSLLHRDFQSSNVMIRAGQAWLIDYQGLRWGLPEYDLASLLFDPYVTLEQAQREELARHYYTISRSGESWEDFRARLDRCTCQRLMQALGAYGYLGLVKGQRDFLRHIPVAATRLREIAVDRGAAPALAPILKLRVLEVA